MLAFRYSILKRYRGKLDSIGEQANETAKQYLKIAEDNGLSLAQMSVAIVTQQPFVTSAIMGATNLDQLKENIESIHVTLNDAVLGQINEVHNTIPNPAP